VPVREFNSYGSRRGNHEVMMRGTFANIRIRNEMLDGVEGGYTLGPDGEQTSIFDAAMAWQAQGTPLVVFGGEQYGAGSSRDWAAKGTNLLGVKAVIAESFERIHRSNLVGMGVIPFEFTGGDTRKTLGLKGDETVSIHGLDSVTPLAEVPCTITYGDGTEKTITLKCRIDTAVEIEYIEHGGVLHYVLRNLASAPVAAE
jgi:aconitate hydratase